MKKLNLLLTTITSVIFLFSLSASAKFEHGIKFWVDGEEYYFDGAPDGLNGAYDIPGHYWNQAGSMQFVGKHYNTGPFGAASFWATGEDDGALLYMVHGILDEWTEENSEYYSNLGYIHYHEIITVSDLTPHPSKVVWLKHTAVRSFYLDGGPAPEFSHEVTPGVDWEFIPNWNAPYGGESFGSENGVLSAQSPVEFKLHGASPNPFNPTTTIRYSISEVAQVNLSVFDLQGRQVAELVNGVRESGTHEVGFDASALSSGVYIYRLQAGSHNAIGKALLTK